MLDERYDPRMRQRIDEGPGALVSTLLSDFTDLMQKEIALAKSELQTNLTDKIMGSVWIAVAGMVVLVGALTAVGSVVALIVTYGVVLHIAAFIVAAALLLVGLIVMAAGRSKMAGDMAPTRSITQVRQDIRTVKEQMQ